MRLTIRDAYATVFTAAGLLLAESVVAGWDWPLMNGVRMGIIVLGVAGMAACSASGWAADSPSFGDPFMIAGVLLGVAALIVAIVGLVAGSTSWLVLLMGAMAALWAVTMLHRLFGRPARSRPVPSV